MSTKKIHPQVYLKRCREEMQTALLQGDQHQIVQAQANLGYALLAVGKNDEGIFHFEQSIELAETVQDVDLQTHCLGIQLSAYQNSGRLPDAYRVAGEILALAEANNNNGMKCDALLSLGQILLDSGEPSMALEQFQAASDIALDLGDQRRMMNVMGILGMYSLQIASTEKALTYYYEARQLAKKLGDQEAEIGFLGNEATMLAYHGNFVEAAEAFETVLAYVTDNGDVEAQLKALHHLIQAYKKDNNFEQVLTFASTSPSLFKTMP